MIWLEGKRANKVQDIAGLYRQPYGFSISITCRIILM